MVTYTENILSYHDIAANSLSAIVNSLNSGQEPNAKKIIRFNIDQAYTLVRVAEQPDVGAAEIYKELVEMDLGDKDIHELTVIMFAWQSRAGIKPVQVHKQRAHIYEAERKRE